MPRMRTPPPLYDQLREGTVRNRVLAWLAAHSYRSAASRGARFGLMMGVLSGLGLLIPGAAPERHFSLSGLVEQAVVGILIASVLAVVATAGARALVRVYARARLSRGPT